MAKNEGDNQQTPSDTTPNPITNASHQQDLPANQQSLAVPNQHQPATDKSISSPRSTTHPAFVAAKPRYRPRVIVTRKNSDHAAKKNNRPQKTRMAPIDKEATSFRRWRTLMIKPLLALRLLLHRFQMLLSLETCQWGSDVINNFSLQKFSDAVSMCGLFDPGVSGNKFTWCRYVGNRVTQLRLLDRVLWNMTAQLSFPEAKVVTLPRLHSDHNPLMFKDSAGDPPNRELCPFRFEAAWLSRNDYELIWKAASMLEDRNIDAIISDLITQSKQWNKDVFGNIFKNKRQMEARIWGIQQHPKFMISGNLQALNKKLTTEFSLLLDQEETFWHKKSRMDWTRDGDRNTRFYHNSAMIRRNKNRIRFLKIQGNWSNDPLLLADHITSFFSNLFEEVATDSRVTMVPVTGTQKISPIEARSLLKVASSEEVRKAVFGMKKFGSPGPDGIPTAFYQKFWEHIGSPVTIMAFITLIPKKEVPETAADFRPITLLNVAFKIISKVLVNRPRPIMCRIIGPYQNSFLPGRSTMDNIILTQEVIHTMNMKKGRKGLMVVKIDRHKAYDSVSWSFLKDTLIEFGFPTSLVQLILFSLENSDISILWNGGRLPSFAPGRGLWQGDPLAPYLFNLVKERLAFDIQQAVNSGQWKPVNVSRGGIGISHLFFADDLMLFGEATECQAKIMMECLNNLSATSGLKVNQSKSQIFCSNNTNAELKRKIGEKMGIPIYLNLGTYLGIPLLHKRVSHNTFFSVIDKMRKKLATWKASALSMAGRRVLVQTSLATTPTYAMQYMRLPVSTCNSIDKICRNFLWGHSKDTRKIHTVSSDNVCMPRECGGLGLRQAKNCNMAFLSKMAWQVTTNQNKLWVKVLKEKYVKDSSFLNATATTNSSWPWKSIIKGAKSLRSGIRWKVGNGNSLNFWHDHWMGSGPISSLPNVTIPLDAHATTVGCMITRENTWDINAIQTLLSAGIVEAIRAVPLSYAATQDDAITWPHSGTGSFTVNSAHALIAGYHDEPTNLGWVWTLKCKEKIKMFLWKMMNNGLLINEERQRRGLAIDGNCPRCVDVSESLDHVFRRCDKAVDCWNIAGAPASFDPSAITPLQTWVRLNCVGQEGNTLGIPWNGLFPHVLWNLAFRSPEMSLSSTPKMSGQQILSDGQKLEPRKPGGTFSDLRIWEGARTNGFTRHLLRKTGLKLTRMELIRDWHGRWITGFSTKIGPTNSFIAELWAMREGLRLAKSRGFNKIVAESDSEALVQAILNCSGSSPEADTLILGCKNLMTSFQACQLIHVLREGNQCADFLANLGQNTTWGTTVWPQPPDGLNNLLLVIAILWPLEGSLKFLEH
ncbi:PREDICTED: uncharacterized protein LOC109152041 [Ipomoea nil]|uniref:uncharacterized protein LOC109152041 n=1 Tax=Ipomoea nil TaxID=35883 RepID=UPI000901929D|nr:PREDICTED: uncharacterized protein LOC109152041 [Ipomoea nil]